MLLFRSAFLVAFIAAATTSGTAQPSGQPESKGAERSSLSPSPGEQLDGLYKRLAETADEEEARGILRQISRAQLLSGSPTADLLMERAARLTQTKDLPLASEMIERILALAPQWPEAWYRRAVLFEMSGDSGRAVVALLKTLSIEPRYIQALEMLGKLYSGGGNSKNALYIYRRALALYPSSRELRETTRQLSQKVEGKEL